jgi:orotate phosphoribosyltransferase
VGIIEEAGARAAGVIIALDRQETGGNGRSAIQEVETSFSIPVISIISLELLIEFLEKSADFTPYLDKIREYQQTYGI